MRALGFARMGALGFARYARPLRLGRRLKRDGLRAATHEEKRMNALAICVDGVEDDELIDAALAWTARFDRIDVWCAYGDAAARELAYVRGRHGRPPPEHGPRAPPPPERLPRRTTTALTRRAPGDAAQRAWALLRAHQQSMPTSASWRLDSGHALAKRDTSDVALFSPGRDTAPARDPIGRARRAFRHRPRGWTGDRRASSLPATSVGETAIKRQCRRRCAGIVVPSLRRRLEGRDPVGLPSPAGPL